MYIISIDIDIHPNEGEKMDNTLTLYREITCNNGDKVMVIFEPEFGYEPQTALSETRGKMYAYIDNEPICKMSIESVFVALDDLSVMDVENFQHAGLVFTGLLESAVTYPQRKLLYVDRKVCN